MLQTLKSLRELGGIRINTLLILSAINEKGPMQVYNMAEATGLSERNAWFHRKYAVNQKLIKRIVSEDKTRATYDLTDKVKELFNH